MANPFEPKMTKAYWAKRPEHGILYLEYPIHGRRIDGLAVIDESSSDKRVETKDSPKLADLAGKRVIVLQTKRNKLGMGVAGQTIISKTLLELEGVTVVAAVAICLEIDEKILGALREHDCDAAVETDPKRSVSAKAA
jgi:hypothetical protein